MSMLWACWLSRSKSAWCGSGGAMPTRLMEARTTRHKGPSLCTWQRCQRSDRWERRQMLAALIDGTLDITRCAVDMTRLTQSLTKLYNGQKLGWNWYELMHNICWKLDTGSVLQRHEINGNLFQRMPAFSSNCTMSVLVQEKGISKSSQRRRAKMSFLGQTEGKPSIMDFSQVHHGSVWHRLQQNKSTWGQQCYVMLYHACSITIISYWWQNISRNESSAKGQHGIEKCTCEIGCARES